MRMMASNSKVLAESGFTLHVDQGQIQEGVGDACMCWRLRLYTTSGNQGRKSWLMLLALRCTYASLAVSLLCSYRVTQKDNGTSTVCASKFVGDEDGNGFVHDTNTWYD